jgi:hypothetical protein
MVGSTGRKSLVCQVPFPFHPFPVFESGEIVIGRVFRIGVEMIIQDRNLSV